VGVVAAFDSFGGGGAAVPGEAAVAAQVVEVDVLPEHPHRQMLEDGLEQGMLLRQAPLGEAPGGDVGMDADHAQGSLLSVPLDDAADGTEPDPVAVPVTSPVLHAARSAGGQAFLESREYRGPVVRVDVVLPFLEA
jgi:hypothetical protein